MSAAKPICQGRIWNGFGYHDCNKSASLEHEGKHFCKIHHPPSIMERRLAANVKFQAKMNAEREARREANDALQERDRRAALFPELLETLNKINDWACFASEEDIAARLMALQQIGVHARAAIAKATGEQA
jgi:hypothetical protein